MKLAVFLLLALVSVVVSVPAESCTAAKCSLLDGCICSLQQSPLPAAQTPQFVVMSFDDAATAVIYQTYLTPLLFNRKNPDGNPIGASFYVPHVYTDYQRVNQLYNRGFEIGVNSISKNSAVNYWATATKTTLVNEFAGQRTVLSNFANIPIDEIVGARTPHYQLNGDVTFEAYKESGILYDSSLPTTARFFPFSLDYRSTAACNIGNCPTESFPGLYQIPSANMQKLTGSWCVSLLACNALGTAEDILNWLRYNFRITYESNRAPFSLLINSGWFGVSENGFEALNLFLDELAALDDVFIVSNREVIEWGKNPVALGEYTSPNPVRSASCARVSCPLKFNSETRYMVSCVPCPNVYPWLGNPLGA